ncbi:dipicolinate synthase subunit DpsA [Arthrobacter sp. 35W]|uniref:dipicolinate synthase subunit DpsA n=1 Tax=Arthrobacter sp. 35W TaxID=1132441 RepID=UPI000415BCF9|nr:dipicolinate synthase subunit DpsA [Arthrobacter sp. 35W]
MQLVNRKIAVVGGDEREQEIARLAATTGAAVSAYGFPWPEGGIAGVEPASSAKEALNGADYALFPIPGQALDGTLFAPESPETITPDEALLSVMADGSTIILGWPNEQLKAAAEVHGIGFSEYEHDVELMLLRAPAIVEGALGQIIANTDVTIHNSDVLVVGHGNIGRILARTLVVLGARVHLAARNPVQRADALAAGCIPHPLEDIRGIAPTVSMLFSTVPTSVVDAGTLALLPPKSLVMDLSAPPGGIDLAAAEKLGHTAVWARGLGRRAPITVGASQWSGIAQRIADIERSKGYEV